jgi:hypothetical protein
MHRPLAALWVLLLTVLLGGSPPTSRPGGVWSDAAMLQSADAHGTPDNHCIRAAMGFHQVLAARPSSVRQSGPCTGALQAPRSSPIFTHQQLGAHPQRDSTLPFRQAGHFPLFPTGPPSHI